MAEPGNEIGDEGAQALADGIKELKALTVLSLHSECVIAHWTVRSEAHLRLPHAFAPKTR